MSDYLPTPEEKPPFFCPHVPHTPARCYRRDGVIIATAFSSSDATHRTCVECGLDTADIDKLSSG